MCKESAPILFADDTKIYFFCGKQLSELESRINGELCNISGWLKANKLSLNISKIHYFVFNRKKNIDTKLKIHIDKQDIEEVLSTKFLGVIMDSKLTWTQHIPHISGKIVGTIGMIIKAKCYLNKNALLTLYHSFVYPYLYPPYPKDRGMLWFYVEAARRPPPATRHPPPAASRPQWC